MGIKKTDLKESNDFLYTLFNNITSAIFIVDSDLIIRNFNDSFRSLFLEESSQIEEGLCGNVLGCKYAVEESVDCGNTTNCDKCNLRNALLKSLVDQVPTYKSKLVRSFYISGIKTEKHLQYTTKYIMYEGSEMVLVIVDDITKFEEQKAELEDINSSKDRFLSILAHDLKGPLNSLAGFLNMLINHIDDLEKTEIIDLGVQLDQRVNNLKQLLQNLLDWAHSKTGGHKYDFKSVEITNMIQENINLFKTIAEEKEIMLNYGCDDKVYAYCDYDSINTVIRNLLSNALKFTQSNGTVSLHVERDASFVRVEIRDNGVGMEEAIIENLFTLNHNTTMKGTANEEGTGLGLVLCNEFARKNNARLEVKSVPQKGSVFTLCLPALKAE